MRYLLKLYVVSQTPNARRALENLRAVCDEQLAGQYELKVIDVLDQPQLAEQDRIIATPTLVKELPEPLRRIIGDLSDREKVLVGLDLVPAERMAHGPTTLTMANREAR